MKNNNLSIGQRFGRLVIVGFGTKTSKFGNNVNCALCRCDCGTEKLVGIDCLKRGNTTSCGCYNRERVRQVVSKGNHSKTRLYDVWTNMKQRCQNPHHPAYNSYGGRGIKVCDKWQEFQPFYEWAIRTGYTTGGKNQSIDRIDVNGNYEPSNCRWATYKEQQNNRTDNKRFNVFGVQMSYEQMSDVSGLHIGALRSRIDIQKMTPEEAVCTKPKNNRNAKRQAAIFAKNIEQFRKVANKVAEICHESQPHFDEWRTNIKEFGDVAAVLPLQNKLDRIKNIIRKGGESNNEPLADSVLDLACYAVMFMVELENRKQ